ncbi:MAG: hypothetical protein Q8934_16970 [Bacillota bacterium]|nr:hypothetical protein [Bacillota bacterium]
MKKISFFLMVMLMFSVMGCSQYENKSIEEQFKDSMNRNGMHYDSIWHIEVKDNYVIIFYENEKKLNIGFMENYKGKWRWKFGIGSADIDREGYLASGELGLPFYLAVVVNPTGKDVRIKVLGKDAKLVQISPNKKLWFAFTSKPPNGYKKEEIN